MEFPLAHGLKTLGLPIILTSGRLNNICFLIDTGSTHNYLFDFVYNHFKDEFKMLDERRNMIGIEGHIKENPTIEATFNFEGVDFTSTFSILDASEVVRHLMKEDGIQIHGIIGIEFLLEHKWIIDFKEYKCIMPELKTT